MSDHLKYRVLLFGAYPEDPNVIRGGVEASIYGLASQLSKSADIEVNVIAYPKKTLKTDFKKNIDRVQATYVANTFSTEILAFLSINRIIRQINNFKPDVVHLHGTHLLDFLLIFYLKIKKYNYVTTVHGILTVEHWKDYKRHKSLATLLKYWIYSCFETLSIKLSKKIIVDTWYVKEWIINKKLATDQQIYIIPQGIDNKFYLIPDQPLNNVLLSIGSISQRKGYTYAIKAVQKVVQQYPQVQYNIIGFCQDANYLSQLQCLIEQCGLTKNISIYKDLDTQSIDKQLSDATVFILHSQEESQGIAFCEAMAVGKPIVTTKVGGIPYVINDKVNGRLVTFGDVDAFASEIMNLLNDSKAREAMRHVNKEEAKKYNWFNISHSILRVYKY